MGWESGLCRCPGCRRIVSTLEIESLRVDLLCPACGEYWMTEFMPMESPRQQSGDAGEPVKLRSNR